MANLSAEPVEITLPPAYAEDALDILTDEAAASVVRLESYAQKWLVRR